MKKLFKISNSEESGQIVVLLAVSLLALLVVAALAVDGGMLYSERRFAQNAADSSSLGAAGYIGNYFVKESLDSSKLICSKLIKSNGEFQGYEEAKIRAGSNNFSDIPFLGYVINPADQDNPLPSDLANNGVYFVCVDKDYI